MHVLITSDRDEATCHVTNTLWKTQWRAWEKYLGVVEPHTFFFSSLLTSDSDAAILTHMKIWWYQPSGYLPRLYLWPSGVYTACTAEPPTRSPPSARIFFYSFLFRSVFLRNVLTWCRVDCQTSICILHSSSVLFLNIFKMPSLPDSWVFFFFFYSSGCNKYRIRSKFSFLNKWLQNMG